MIVAVYPGIEKPPKGLWNKEEGKWRNMNAANIYCNLSSNFCVAFPPKKLRTAYIVPSSPFYHHKKSN